MILRPSKRRERLPMMPMHVEHGHSIIGNTSFPTTGPNLRPLLKFDQASRQGFRFQIPRKAFSRRKVFSNNRQAMKPNMRSKACECLLQSVYSMVLTSDTELMRDTRSRRETSFIMPVTQLSLFHVSQALHFYPHVVNVRACPYEAETLSEASKESKHRKPRLRPPCIAGSQVGEISILVPHQSMLYACPPPFRIRFGLDHTQYGLCESRAQLIAVRDRKMLIS